MVGKLVSIDFETYLISDEMPIPKPVCLSYAYSETDKGLVVGYSDMDKLLGELLNSDKILVAHNATFECLVILKHFPHYWDLVWNKIAKRQFYCTQLYQQLINNISEKQINKLNLAGLVESRFDIDISESKNDPDAWRLNYDKLDGVPLKEWPQDAINYAIEDSVWALKVLISQFMEKHQFTLVPHLEAGLALNWMGLKGIPVDKDRVEILRVELEKLVKPLYNYLIEAGYSYVCEKTGKIKKRTKIFREYIENKYLENVMTTDKGNTAIGNEAIKHYLSLDPKDELLLTFQKLQDYEKILTAFVPSLESVNTVMRTQYNPIVSSGRTSSRTSKAFPSVNIQQLPREVKDVTYDVRNCFVPRKGFQICSIDYNGLELASTANQLYNATKQSKMRDIINSGKEPIDMHSVLASKLMSRKLKKTVTYQQFIDRKKEAEFKRYRQLAKPINLGFPGGIGYDTMRGLLLKADAEIDFKVLGETEAEQHAKYGLYKLRERGHDDVRIQRTGYRKWAVVKDELVALKREMFKLYPELERFLSKTHETYTTGKIKAMKNEWGEWEKEPMYAFDTQKVRRDYCTYTSFCNGYLMQTPAAVGAKAAMVQLVKEFENNEDCNILAFIHDEVILEVRKNAPNKFEIIDRVSEILIDKMQEVLYTVRIAVEADLMDYWRKDNSGGWSNVYWKDYDSDILRRSDETTRKS